jgi:hypothetical protein
VEAGTEEVGILKLKQFDIRSLPTPFGVARCLPTMCLQADSLQTLDLRSVFGGGLGFHASSWVTN